MADNYVVKDGNGNTLTVKSKATSTNDANGNPIQIVQSAISDASGNPLADSNPLAAAVQSRQVSYTDRSAGTTGNAASITTTSAQILAANASRKGLIIVNLDTANTIWINYGAAAVVGAGSIPVLPYGYYECPLHMMPTAAVYAISSAGTVLFTCKECN